MTDPNPQSDRSDRSEPSEPSEQRETLDWSALFDELCDASEDVRARRLAEIAVAQPGLAARMRLLLAADAADPGSGPLERAADLVAASAEVLAGSASEPSLGIERVGRWRLLERLGRGGMGEVWLAERDDGEFAQRAAIKFVRPGALSDDTVERLRLERRILARFDHPAIARVYDGGIENGQPWFAMEVVAGRPIHDYVLAHGLSLEQRLRLFVEVCEAVAYAHRNLVVHRDLKPANVLVDASGRPKLLDFGIAKSLEPDGDLALTRTEMRVLTPAYAAPEQILGQPVTTATDVYALGVLLFQLLTDELPHARSASSSGGLAAELTRETVERPSQRLRRRAAEATLSHAQRVDARRLVQRLSGDLDTLLLMAMRREPDRRYPSAAALADDVRRFLEDRPIAARPDTMRYRLRKMVERNRAATVATLLITVALIGGVSVALVQGRAAKRQAARAERVLEFLTAIFRSLDPDVGPGRNALAGTLLIDGAHRIESELQSEPEVEAALFETVGRSLLSLERLDEAASYAQKALAARTRLGDSRIVASTLLGEIQNARENLPAGETLLRGALQEIDAPRLEVARAQSALGSNLSAQDRHPEALPWLERAQATLEELRGRVDRETVRALLRRSNALRYSGRSVDAQRLVEDTVTALEREPQPNPVTRGLLDVELAQLAYWMRQPRDGHAYATRALETLEKALGPGAAAIADAYFARAQNLGQQGDFVAAEADHRRAMAVLTAIDPDHPRLRPLRIELALSLEHLGRVDEGIALRRDVLASTERRLGPDSAAASTSRLLLGSVLVAANRLEEAEPLFTRELALLRSHRAPLPRVNTDDVLSAYASLLNRLGRHAEAVEIARERLRSIEALGASAPPHIGLGARIELARNLIELDTEEGRREARAVALEAREAAERNAKLRPGFQGGVHNDSPSLLLARLDLEEGQPEDAAVAAERALTELGATGAAQISVIRARMILGQAREALGDRRAAEEAYRAAYDLSFRRRGGKHESTLEAKRALDRLATERGASG